MPVRVPRGTSECNDRSLQEVGSMGEMHEPRAINRIAPKSETWLNRGNSHQQ